MIVDEKNVYINFESMISVHEIEGCKFVGNRVNLFDTKALQTLSRS